MSLVKLPSETITGILSHLESADIRGFQQVCRRFRDLVAADWYLQYVLELALCGYAPPTIPRLDLKYFEKLQALREHRRKWEDLGSIQPAPIHFSAIAESSSGEFMAGVYARGFQDSNPPSHPAGFIMYTIEFYQLPSSNTGSGLKKWTHTISGARIVKFAIQPAQDLLVLVQLNMQRATEEDPIDKTMYTIHLKALTTNEPHPAALGNTELQFEIQIKRPTIFNFLNVSDKTLFTHISGHFLGIVFRSSSSEARTHVVVWNWVSGRKVAHLSVRGSIHASAQFAFLSDGYFVVPRNSGYMNAATGTVIKTKGTSNYLDVYRLPSPEDEDEDQEAYQVASFAIPAPKDERYTSSLELFGPPTLVPSKCLSTSSTPPPALYGLTPDQYVLSVYNVPNLWTADSVGSTFSNGALYFPAQLLLSFLARLPRANPTHDREVTIPWRDWGAHTSWVDMDTKWLNPSAFSQEQRLLTLGGHSAPKIHRGLCAISILNFNGQRLSAREAGKCDIGAYIHVPPGRPVMEANSSMPGSGANEQRLLEHEQTSQFLSGKTKAKQVYLRTNASLQLPEYHRLRSCRVPWVGDEHVVIEVVLKGSAAETGILVYSL